MNILITGATGFIGSYVLQLLLKAEHHVNALVRDTSELSLHPGLKIFKGDITSEDDVHKSMNGCDIIIHLAALVSTTAEDRKEFFRINFQGTENLLKAAIQYKVKKIIFTSSLSAHAYIPQPFINEESLIKPEKYFSEYAEAKAKAEELVIQYSEQGLPYIIIYPARVFGRGPLTDANGATKALYLYLKNKLPFLIDGGEQYSSWAFVDDVAGGIVSAAVSNITNQKYILGGENKTLAEVYKMADAISGRKHLKINIRQKSALSIASVIEFYAKLLKKHPLITREWLEFVTESQKISSEKATTGLNYKITPLKDALVKTIDWLKH